MKQGYAPYDEGIKQDVFVKDITGNNYVGQVGWNLALPAGQCRALGTLHNSTN